MSGISFFKHPAFSDQNQAFVSGTIKQMEYFPTDTIYDVGQSFLPTDFLRQALIKIKSINGQPKTLLIHANLPSSLFSKTYDQLKFHENIATFSKHVRLVSTFDGKSLVLDLKLPEKRIYELAHDNTQKKTIDFSMGMSILKWSSFASNNEPTFLKNVQTANLKVVAPFPQKGAEIKEAGVISSPVENPKTRIVVRCDAGYGNALFLRGNASLNWNQGVKMEPIEPDLWALKIDVAADSDFEFKVLLNDENWEKTDNDENHKGKPGDNLEITPTF